jgi:hypothetical protein
VQDLSGGPRDPVLLRLDFYGRLANWGAYLPRSFRASSHNLLGSRSPFFASSMINFATVIVMGSLRSTRPSLLSAASNAAAKFAMSSGPTRTDSRCRGVLELARPTPNAGYKHIILRDRCKGRQQVRTRRF